MCMLTVQIEGQYQVVHGTSQYRWCMAPASTGGALYLSPVCTGGAWYLLVQVVHGAYQYRWCMVPFCAGGACYLSVQVVHDVQHYRLHVASNKIHTKKEKSIIHVR